MPDGNFYNDYTKKFSPLYTHSARITALEATITAMRDQMQIKIAEVNHG